MSRQSTPSPIATIGIDIGKNTWTVLKTWSIASISDSIRLDGFGAKACGDSQGFSISMIG